MSPKEKAEERVNKYFKLFEDNTGHWNILCAKYCALAEINEILNVISENTIEPFVFDIDYWQEVKQEIEKL
jgi:hypothetical protein